MAFIYFPAAQATLNTEHITRIVWSTNETLKGFVHFAADTSDKNSVVTLTDGDAEKLWGIMHPSEPKPTTAQ
ncbi:MAG: hypothetical protein KME42_11680 [Tildeniella nuda ZEHNDER 1965/U140]|jgi:hypothetical protein|nr:hypothetical protein [Tildeniella nuda ZEHNDER 1965/U140]